MSNYKNPKRNQQKTRKHQYNIANRKHQRNHEIIKFLTEVK